MKKPWQIWTLFCVCLLAIVIAMSWLSLKTIRLDGLRESDRAETEMARREAELQERISSALYRMDLKMLPLVIHEAARPPYFYRFPSEIHSPSANLVLLRFQIDAQNNISSPDSMRQQTLSQIQLADQAFDYQTLLRQSTEMDHAEPNNSLATSAPPLNYDNKIDAQLSRGTKRVNEDYSQRRLSTLELTQQSLLNNSLSYGLQMTENNTPLPTKSNALQAVPMQPTWMNGKLIFVRRVDDENGMVFQCCWLNWQEIEHELQNEVAELLPNVQFEAITPNTQLKIGTALTTIPVQLVIDRPAMLARLAMDLPATARSSAFSISLLAAWCCLGLAALASALLLRGVLRLSERRAAFVSAVTHELRTPLTTFRMYSEMLADGMVPPEKSKQYANTLKVQADRLSHLVENVLLFAKLERSSARIHSETVTVEGLISRFSCRLMERADDSQMRLVIEVPPSVAIVPLSTQPAVIEQILFNLVDNACKYAQSSADNRIILSVGPAANRIQFRVQDFGPGITSVDRKRLYEPFHQSRTAKANAVAGVGLGLALCDRMAKSIAGRLFDKDCSTGAVFILELPSG
ncbi:Alkaline phosphatase synthesis sensor protein PhoR [Novipirellula aureliae]|uniref:histidine kinase n=1 Tax=Novipirellula aureliae TaxID=2527966 RepID=A0A5C6E4V5_9BACT|nr:HAMP domain-containing sensor histidine kinase [Novipirellula aureliae]TWU43715.1 Alkaline phosphatase synthesis sensor protein PhoR [Novipirellula aureliae]